MSIKQAESWCQTASATILTKAQMETMEMNERGIFSMQGDLSQCISTTTASTRTAEEPHGGSQGAMAEQTTVGCERHRVSYRLSTQLLSGRQQNYVNASTRHRPPATSKLSRTLPGLPIPAAICMAMVFRGDALLRWVLHM